MKKKKNLLLTISALAMSALILSGCGKQNTQSQLPPANQGESAAPSGQESEHVKADSFLTVAEMLGKSDAEVKDLFNGGAENKTEDGSILLGRSYSTMLDKNTVTLETIYDDAKNVSAISATFSDKTAEEVKAIMTDAFGEPAVQDETQEMESKRITWTKDQFSFAMNESYGMPIVEFTRANG